MGDLSKKVLFWGAMAGALTGLAGSYYFDSQRDKYSRSEAERIENADYNSGMARKGALALAAGVGVYALCLGTQALINQAQNRKKITENCKKSA